MIKGYDLMKQAEENKQKYEGRRYEVVSGSAIDCDGQYIQEVEIKNGVLVKKSENLTVYIYNNTGFEEMQQPVDIKTAANSGKRIKPKTGEWEYQYPWVWFGRFGDCKWGINNTNYLKYFNGEWLIEPEEGLE